MYVMMEYGESSYTIGMSAVRTTISLDEDLASQARSLGVNVSLAAREGIRAAVRQARSESDRQAYVRHPEVADEGWAEVEAWGE